ncbi:MAG: hypothetical protein DRO01_07150 [Thermoproteota archaeon]|nr:MAG: hypothetical protein DRO01_07150 [Candidatus Korarchaeota archaeon]
MSFEGYYQILCERGHYWTEDVYLVDDPVSELRCPKCGGRVVWYNLVDVTNGSYDEDGNRIDGYVELEIEEERVCPLCNSVLERRYKIPEYIVKYDWEEEVWTDFDREGRVIGSRKVPAPDEYDVSSKFKSWEEFDKWMEEKKKGKRNVGNPL